MLQDDDYKIRNAIDRLSLTQPSVGSKITSWWMGLSTAFTTNARRAALQINTVIDKAFTPEPSPETVMPWSAPVSTSELTAPVQKTMAEESYIDSAPVSVATPKLERQQSFIVEPPTCDCTCDIPSAECDAPSAEYLATDADSTSTATATATATTEPTLGADTDSAIWSPSGHGRVSGGRVAFESEVAEVEKKEL